MHLWRSRGSHTRGRRVSGVGARILLRQPGLLQLRNLTGQVFNLLAL